MSDKSNNKGRAYEYICLMTLYREIKAIRSVEIVENSSLEASRRAWKLIDETTQSVFAVSAKAAVVKLFDMEPLLVENSQNCLKLFMQPDFKGEYGDVRDIIVSREDIRWEIGLSIKHNHFAVKHSRLAKNLDFGERWFHIPCSQEYWEAVRPIFNYLTYEKIKGTKWQELSNKQETVYVPLLTAFINEINRSNSKHSDVPQKMVEYLLGEFDFYKVISIDHKRLTQIQSYNLRGTLNKPSKIKAPVISIPAVNLPSRIVSLNFKPGSNTTVELYMDKGWQFSFRIHNAYKYVEPSLKFDVQIIGLPVTVISINCLWN